MSTRFKKSEDEVAYILECDEEMLRFRVTLVSGIEITPEMVISALSAFIHDYQENPKQLFTDMHIMQYPTH